VKQFDYIIVGCGLAGIALSELLLEHKKSFVLFDDGTQQSSTVAAGMYNPVILKRFTPVWKAAEQLKSSIPVYQAIEAKLGIHVDYQFDLLRRFTSVEEQNQWFDAADKPRLAPFLDLDLKKNNNPQIDAPFGYGRVNEAGRVDTALLVSRYQQYLTDLKILRREAFQYNLLQNTDTGVVYQGLRARQVVFCEGYGVRQNPFFKHLPLTGNKGEVLTVKIDQLRLETPIKSSVFIIPLGGDLYRVGATYNHKDKSNMPTAEARAELLDKLKRFIKAPVELVDHKAGIRPTVKDRRPLVGRHPEHINLYLLNGLGSRGVMIAPYAAKQLFDFIEQGLPLDPEMDLSRFNR
jgi:glycine/D-amino acid oxidase-like deaminating enzyme